MYHEKFPESAGIFLQKSRSEMTGVASSVVTDVLTLKGKGLVVLCVQGEMKHLDRLIVLFTKLKACNLTGFSKATKLSYSTYYIEHV